MRAAKGVTLLALALALGGCGGWCRVHPARMEKQTVPIEYGLLDLQYSEARRSYFPNGGSVEGGCGVDPDRTHRIGVYVCSWCVEVTQSGGVSTMEPLP